MAVTNSSTMTYSFDQITYLFNVNAPDGSTYPVNVDLGFGGTGGITDPTAYDAAIYALADAVVAAGCTFIGSEIAKFYADINVGPIGGFVGEPNLPYPKPS